jgi:hypothetical protein
MGTTNLRCLLVSSFVAFVLLGCATDHWSKAGATAEDFYRDSWECARQTTYREGTKVNKDLYRACLNARGYSRNDPNGWKGLRD